MFTLPLNPYWIAGFTSGDGSFTITINVENGRTRVRFKFNLTQHTRDIKLINYFITFFNCGSVYINRETASYNVYGFSLLNEKIIPFFIQYPVLGIKHDNFKLWVEAIEIVNKKEHNTTEGLAKIKALKEQMK